MIIVLLNVRAIAMYIEGRFANPKARAMKYPTALVNSIWPSPVATLVMPTFLRLRRSRFIPTKNKRKAIPISPNTSSPWMLLVT